MNEEAHWNNIAPDYNEEIFDVFKSDKKKKLRKYFRKHSNETFQVIDFGSGIGKAFPYLSPLFGKILAVDISQECITLSKSNPYTNIQFRRLDLTRSNLRLPEADFALCCNVAILPDLDKNFAIIGNIQKALRTDASAIIVVPSLESVLFSSWRLMEWYKKEGVTADEIPDSELSYFKGSKREIVQGVVNINGVPTKHYTQSELQVLFDSANLSITAIEQLEYDWNTEFDSPPEWMQAPYPWDWLIECKKTA